MALRRWTLIKYSLDILIGYIHCVPWVCANAVQAHSIAECLHLLRYREHHSSSQWMTAGCPTGECIVHICIVSQTTQSNWQDDLSKQQVPEVNATDLGVKRSKDNTTYLCFVLPRISCLTSFAPCWGPMRSLRVLFLTVWKLPFLSRQAESKNSTYLMA